MTITMTLTHATSADSNEMITSFLGSHPQGVVSTINARGLIESSVVNLFSFDDYEWVFMTKKDTRKYKNLMQNPTISFVTYDAFSRSEVEIEGIARVIADDKERAALLARINDDAHLGRRHVSPYVDDIDEAVVFKLYPRKVHMTTYWEEAGKMQAFHEAIDFDIKMSH